MSTDTPAPPPCPVMGWATPKGDVLWDDMARQINWLEAKDGTPEEIAEHKRKASTLRGWCTLFEHDLTEVPS